MLHFRKYYDGQAACGATLYPGEHTIYPNSVQCPACRARIKVDEERKTRLFKECHTLADFDNAMATLKKEEKEQESAAVSCEVYEYTGKYTGSPADGAKSFAVMLYHAPVFPDSKPAKDGVERLAVFAANDDHGAWGWVELSQVEKDCIGQELLNSSADVGKWYRCILWEKTPPTGQLVAVGGVV